MEGLHGYQPPISEIKKDAEDATAREHQKRGDAKNQRTLKQVFGLGAAAVATAAVVKFGAGEAKPTVQALERQTPGREAPQNPAVKAAEKSAQDFAAAKELGGSPVVPTAEEQRQAESGTLKNPE